MSQPSRVTATARREATPAEARGPRPPGSAPDHPAHVRRGAHQQAARRTTGPEPGNLAVPPAHARGDGLRRRRGAAPWRGTPPRSPTARRGSRGRSMSESRPKTPSAPSSTRSGPRSSNRRSSLVARAASRCGSRRAARRARRSSASARGRGGRVAARSRWRTVGALRRDAREGHWRRLMNVWRRGPLRAAQPAGSRTVRTSCDSRRAGRTARRSSVTAQPDATNVSPES